MFDKKLVIFLLSGVCLIVGCQTSHRENDVVFSRLTGDYWQIWTMERDGKKALILTDSESDKRYPAWNSKGTEIFYRDNNNYAYVIDLETGTEKRILESFGRISSLKPSPDDSKLLFVRFRSELLDSSDLWITNRDGKDQKILTRDAGLQYNPKWSADGKKIVYISGHGYQTHELCVINSNGRSRKQLTNDKSLELLPAFSPDGEKIAYVSDIGDDYEIWVMHADGSESVKLTDSYGIDTHPVWSPDGSEIMFVSNRNKNQQIWLMNSDGSNPKQITKGSPCIDPSWRNTECE